VVAALACLRIRSASAASLALKVYGDAVLALKLDVTDKSAVFAAVRQAKDHFGRLHVIVNNAGYGPFGAVEELSEEDLRKQFETNMFGPLWVVQAALPIMRERGSGHISQILAATGRFAAWRRYHAPSSRWRA
jgi:NAD(P)-dependent dehydrogenase (short-subunit alcohol dehydrogenase family)